MPSGTRGENPVAIAHLHTTLNKSRDEKLISTVPEAVSLIDRRCPLGGTKKLLVGESNPGRLRDRQKCYQLHQRGLD